MMKNILLSASAFLMILSLKSCSNDDSAAAAPVKNNYLEVKVNGNKKVFSNVKGRWVDGGNYLELTATDNGSEWLSITVLSDATRVPVGLYTLDDGTPYTILAAYSLIVANGQQNYTATKGTAAVEDAFVLDLNKISNSAAEGTFSGTVVSVEGLTTTGLVTLTDGTFNVSIDPN